MTRFVPFLLLLLCLPLQAVADTVAPGWSASYYFASRDPRPVRVVFKNGRGEQKVFPVMEIPRNILFYAAHYLGEDYDELPPTVTTWDVSAGVWLSFRDPPVQWDKSLVQETRKFVSINIYRTANKQLPWGRRFVRPLPDHEGLKVTGLLVADPTPRPYRHVYHSPAGDMPFSYIECSATVHKFKLCSHVVQLCPDLMLEVGIPDFRVRGGLKFAIAETHRIRNLVRPWIKDCYWTLDQVASGHPFPP